MALAELALGVDFVGKVVKLHHARSFEALLELFLFEKRAEGRAPRTIRDYEEHIW